MNKIEVAKQLRLNSETRLYHIPEFSGANIPLREAARIMNKDYQFVRAGLIEGFLPIGMAYRQPSSSIYNFYISPKLFWEHTGYVYNDKV